MKFFLSPFCFLFSKHKINKQPKTQNTQNYFHVLCDINTFFYTKKHHLKSITKFNRVVYILYQKLQTKYKLQKGQETFGNT
jgi:hypothetical protein